MPSGNPVKGRIFEIKRFAVHDGPGIRTTVFFKGCPLNCMWCHNPEGIAYGPEIALFERKCVSCGECFRICPVHKLGENGAHQINRENCRQCLACVNGCMPQALKVYGIEYKAEELLETVRSDSDFYSESGGGITCSGGEPLMQPDFLVEFLSLCKDALFHTAVDTSGMAAWSSFEKILPFTDLFLYDIKHIDGEEHKKIAGGDNRLILDNLKMLSDSGAAVEVRMPVIPGLNDDEECIQRTAELLKGIKTLTLIRPLAYNRLLESKYASIGKECAMPKAVREGGDAAHRVSDILANAGLPVCPPD